MFEIFEGSSIAGPVDKTMDYKDDLLIGFCRRSGDESVDFINRPVFN